MQVVLALTEDATVRSIKVISSLKSRLVTSTKFAVLSIVKVSVETVLSAGTGLGAKAFVKIGTTGAVTTIESLAVSPTTVSLVVMLSDVLNLGSPTALPCTTTERVQVAPAAILPPLKERRVASADGFHVPPQVFAALGVSATSKPAPLKSSVKAIPVNPTRLPLLSMVKVKVVVSP